MRVELGKDEKSWTEKAWTWIHRELKPGQRVFVPAGGTPLPLYRKWCSEPTPLLKSLRLLQLDEILSGPRQGEFKKFFEQELPSFLPQMEWIQAADATADAAILGVGVNGHVAFHEPGLPKKFPGGCVRLTSETLSYLALKEPTWGLTYGVDTFLRAQKILVLVKGERKKPIMQKVTKDQDLPISWILRHPNVTVISDFEWQ